MQPFHLVRQLKRDFIDYVSSKFPFADDGNDELDRQLRSIMEKEGSLFQDPVLQLVRTRARLTPDLSAFEPSLRETIQTLDELKNPYSHQVKAWNRINAGLGTVISTGTGSGKSESFILPVLNGLLKEGFGKTRHGIGAVFIYPMNALVHDQFYRIIKYAAGTGLKVGIYNGAFKELSPTDRKKICDEITQIAKRLKEERPDLTFDPNLFDPSRLVVDPAKPETIPHILLTNYKMLEYMLLRAGDQALFAGTDLKYLVLDEAHTYTGTLALEMACLLNRLKVHLGDNGRSFLPIATSATLSQGTEANEAKMRSDMHAFFTRLFGRPFENGDNWLIKDEFVPLIDFNRNVFSTVLKTAAADSEGLNQDLEADFPESLFRLAKRFAGVDLSDYRSCARSLLPFAQALAPHILSVLLKDNNGRETTMVDWYTACNRFSEHVQGSPALLEALLILMSHSFENERFPEIGLRYHLFGRAQPRIYWTLDGKILHDDQTLTTTKQTALNFVSCRKCGHSGWAGLLFADNQTAAEEWEVRTLPERFDEENLSSGVEAAVFHDPHTIPEGGEHLAKSWRLESYAVDLRPDRARVRLLGKNGKLDSNERLLVRVERSQKKKTGKSADTTTTASDFHSCPACSLTSPDRPVMNTHRSSASVDLSVHTASLLSRVASDGTTKGDNAERKLLIFCDNRQETSFLSGFLTDRHRRLNLRRAVASFLHAATLSGDSGSWLLKKPSLAEDRSPRIHRYDFTLRLLLSIEQGAFFSRTEPFPSRFLIKKRTIQNLLPREVLQSNDRDPAFRQDDRKRALKEWLLENYTINEAQGVDRESDLVFDLMADDDKCRFVLELLTDVMALDLTAVQVREGSLLTLGLATWDFPTLTPASFEVFAKANPNLGLGSKELFLLAVWLIEELSDVGALGDVDLVTARLYLGRFKGANPRPVFTDLLGQSVANGNSIAKSSQLGRILLSIGGESILTTWSNLSVWRTFIKQSPLAKFVFLSSGDQDAPLINVVGELHVSPSVSTWRSKLTGAWRVTPARFSFTGAPTGRRAEDTWEMVEQPPHEYYRKLYHQPLSSEARLVSAMEHNGMISASDQNEAVRKFNDGAINTLVATPTLEMGVDLPDLPTVIHRSVPPDPSNYAQRAGRAGRGPKRALIFTYCGLGSHEMTFFESPLDMASGEILPPGMPVENTFIIGRHLNGLILEAMGLSRPESDPIDLTSWSKLVDLSQQVAKAREALGQNVRLPENEVQNWRAIYIKRHGLINKLIEDFLHLTKSHLWDSLSDDPAENEIRCRHLMSELRQFADTNSWPDAFQSELDLFKELVDLYLQEFMRLGEVKHGEILRMSEDQKRSHDRAILRARFLIQTHLGAGQRYETPQPISDLAASGFLPNFDFPGRVTRFRGIRINPPGSERRYSDLLKYDRSATVALREFAPEQKIYGHGWIYEVDRYIATQNTSLSSAGWGVCLNSCTQLIPSHLDQCPQCGGEVLKAGEQSASRPELIEIKEVHGSQSQVISDSSSKREMNYFTVDVKLVGLPKADKSSILQDAPDVRLDHHLSRDRSIQTLQIVQRRDGVASRGGRLGGALYREASDDKSFAVRLGPPPAQSSGRWRPFIPAVQNEGPGIVLHLPLSTAIENQWVQGTHSDPERALEEFYRTLSAALERAAQKVLRLNRRMNHLDISENRVMTQGESSHGTSVSRLSLLILDTEKGGSGIIPLIESYWDQIMAECQDLIRKDCCENGCYRCLKSYDNQWDHEYIRKSIFKVESEVPLFDALKKSKWQTSDPGTGQSADSTSAVEPILLDWLRAEGIDFKTQVEMKSPSGKLVTVPDFEVVSGARRVQLFVDGWEHHGNTSSFFKDIEKRNFVAKRGWSVMWVPGHWPRNEAYLEKLKAALTPATPLQALVRKEKRLERLPGLDEVIYQRLFEGLHGSVAFYPLQPFDIGDSSDARLLLLDEALNDLKKAFHPFAMTEEGLVLCFVKGDEVMSSKETWHSWSLMQTALASLGYRVINAWLGPKPSV